MLLKLCVVAFHCYSLGLTLQQQEPTFCRDVKDCLPLLANPGINSYFVRHGGANSKANPLESMKLLSGPMDSRQLVKIDSPISLRVIDIQVPRTNAVSFTFGIRKQCMRQEKILQFFKATAAEAERGGLDISILSNMMQFQSVTIDVSQQLFEPFLFYPSGESDANVEKPFLNFFRNPALSSKFVAQPDGQILFTGSGAEMRDILLVVVEFYFSKNSLNYMCLGIPEKIKVKSLTKKKNGRRAGMERDLYQKNCFHACESLLSLMTYQKQSGKTAILSLKKSMV